MRMESFTEPLFIDTNIEYELDMSRFPGWEDPLQRYQPKLIIHQPGTCPCDNSPQDLQDLLDTPSELFLDSRDVDLFLDSRDVDLLTDCVINDVPDVEDYSWEAQLAPISIPTFTPTSESTETYIPSFYCCSRKRKRPCSEDYDNNEELLHKKIHLDSEEILDFLYFFTEDSYNNIACSKGDLCRGS